MSNTETAEMPVITPPTIREILKVLQDVQKHARDMVAYFDAATLEPDPATWHWNLPRRRVREAFGFMIPEPPPRGVASSEAEAEALLAATYYTGLIDAAKVLEGIAIGFKCPGIRKLEGPLGISHASDLNAVLIEALEEFRGTMEGEGS